MTPTPLEQMQEGEGVKGHAIEAAAARLEDASTPGEAQVAEVDLNHSSSPELQRSFHQNGVLEEPLNGKTGEAIAKTVLEHEPGLLNDVNGNPVEVENMVDGFYDGVHGADLIAVDKLGRPYCIEVKTVNMGKAHLNQEGLKSIKGAHGETVTQMDDEWVRDRWRRVAFDDENAMKLLDAGVDPKYLDPDRMGNDSSLWDEILGTKMVVVVSPHGEDAVGGYLENQCNQRNVHNIVSVKTPGKG